MNQVLLEDEDRNEPRGLLYDIQGERVKTLYTILAPDISIFCPVFPPCSLLRESVSRYKRWQGRHYEFTKLDFSNARKSLTQEILICENTIFGAHAWLQYLPGGTKLKNFSHRNVLGRWMCVLNVSRYNFPNVY